MWKNHGHATKGISPTYHSWAGMKARCNNPNHKSYKNYGGKGIKVCDEWNEFPIFLADMGNKPKGLSLDRIDNDGNYCKDNCCWSSPEEQANNKTNNHFLTFKGKTQTLKQWANELNVNYGTLRDRKLRGWSDKKTIEIPFGSVAINNRSRMITYQGKTLTVAQWSRKLNVSAQVIYQRIHRKKPTDKILCDL